MRRLLVALASLGACLVAACGGPAEPEYHRMATAFDPAAAAWVKQPGTGRIAGRAYLVDAEGQVRAGPYREISLYPETPYTVEMVEAAERGQYVTPDIRLSEFERQAPLDAEGRFAFSDLPAGRYVLYTLITWQDRRPLSMYGVYNRGAALARRVEIGPGQSLAVELTR